MNRISDVRRWLNRVIVVLGVVVVLACGGAGTGTFNTLGWELSGPSSVVHASPSTRLIKLKLNSAGGEYHVRVTLKGAPPAGWTVNLPSDPIHLNPPTIDDVAVDALVTVPAGQPSGSVKQLTFVATQTSGQNAGAVAELGVTVTIGTPTTSVREVTPFTDASNVFESLLEITWGEGTPWSTLMGIKNFNFTLPGFAGPGDAVVWFSPKSGGISLDVGDVDEVTVKVLPTTNKADRTFNLTPYFAHTSGDYGVAQSLSVDRGVNGIYEIMEIDHLMGVRLTDPDKSTTYTVKFTNIAPGRLTFAAILVPGRFAATVTPPFVDINVGDPATVRVDVTRVGEGLFEDTEEFTLRATHGSVAAHNQAIKLPIQSYLGR